MSEPAAALWRHTLARIPSLFGRLVFLASLRNRNGGEYAHQSLSQMVGPEEADTILRRSHAQVFQDWLTLSLEQQKADLEEYLLEVPSPAAVLDGWIGSKSYRDLAPRTAQEMERDLFVSDLEALLPLLRQEYGGPSPDRGA